VGQVEALAVLLDALGDADALLVVAEALREEAGKQLLADVPERRMPDVVAQGHRLEQILVQLQRGRHRPADRVHLEDVGQPGAVVVAHRRQEHLGLVLRPPKRFGMDDAIAVDLEGRPGR
jgi:hypothetical protein